MFPEKKRKFYFPCCLIQESNEIDQFQIWGVKEKKSKVRLQETAGNPENMDS